MSALIKNVNVKKCFHPIFNFVFRYKFLIAVIIVCGCYAGITFNQTMPFAEGWYTYYAQCMNKGEIVYKDFDYLFTPLYIYLVAFITKFFGYKIIVLRFIGIIFFCLIGCMVFLTFREVFGERISTIASITAVFFMQSEVVQIFYDYIRLADVFSCATIFFLVKAIKVIGREKKCNIFLFCAGISNSLFFLIKQNMGVLFFVYSIILIFATFLVLHKNIRYIVYKEGFLIAGFLIPVLMTCVFMLANGSLFAFFNQTGSEAIAAKGGIMAILFGWFHNNANSFESGTEFAVIILIILAIVFFFRNRPATEKSNLVEKIDKYLLFVFISFCIVGFIIFSKAESIAKLFDGHKYLSPYSVFLIVFPLFVAFVIHVIIKAVKGKEIQTQELLYIVLSGSYFAISYGCGMSGGLAEGQSTIGVALIISLLLYYMNFKFSEVLRIIVMGVCLLVTLQSAAKKMNYTYNWWGMDESDFWDSTAVSSDIEILDGIGMSEETLEAYETIYHVITENTGESDPIYCFPQIPIFYSICNRTDPGVRAKVQWFDVASDFSIDKDMKILEGNPPRAILIYETSEYAYTSHESSFRSGEVSATRRMKQFLLDYVWKYDYTFYGRITSTDNNSFLLYYKTDDDFSVRYAFEGEGTMDSPYLISSAADLVQLREAVANGNDYAGIYFQQTSDIDLSEIENWNPIGEFDSGSYFRGIYDGAGHVIENMNCIQEGNVGLFGQLGGIVCNLGIINSHIVGECVGVISSHAVDSNSMIANCYTDSVIEGTRAGGIADNFCGKIINSVSYSKCQGLRAAGAISYQGGYSNNVYALYDGIKTGIIDSYGDSAVVNCTEEYLSSADFLYHLNNEIDKITHCNSYYQDTGEYYNEESEKTYETWMSKVTLTPWEFSEEGYPVLYNGSE